MIMQKEIVITLALKDRDLLGNIRTQTGLSAKEVDDFIYVRGIPENPNIAIKKLPALNTYTLSKSGELFPIGKSTPVAVLDGSGWISIQEYIEVEPPLSALPGVIDKRYTMSLLPSEMGRTGSAILTSFETWINYAESAPGIRLEKLVFAVSEHKEVLIMGNPLPAIPGQEFWASERFLIPCGYDFEYPVLTQLFQEKISQNQHSYIMLSADGNMEIIPEQCFVKATRSAIRLSKGVWYE